MTLSASRSAISSLAADSGPLQLDLLAGLTTNPSGPEAAPASPSRRPAKAEERMIQGICGRTYIASSVPDGPLSSWESRLRERLATVGSTESALIWRAKDTPAGQLISRLAVSTRHINGTDNTGSQWPTMKAANAGPDFAKADRSKTGMSVQTVIALAQRAADEVEWDPSSPEESPQSAETATWSTPRASDGAKGSPNQKFSAGGQPLPAQIHQAHMWATTSVVDGQGRGYQRSGGKIFLSLPGMMDETRAGPKDGTERTGLMQSGSSATTEKRGAPNPVFAFWLMGFPDEWISGALAAMQSYRKPRRK